MNDSDQGLSYAAKLPLSWMTLDSALDEVQLEAMNDDNLRVLVATGVLMEHRQRGEDASPVEQEMERLHLKINLLLDMVGSLAAGQRPRPAAVTVALSATGLSWRGEALTPGAHGLIALWLHRAIATPLKLPAVAAGLVDGQNQVSFAHLSAPFQSELERHVFLHHRRAVAGARSAHHTLP